MEPRALLIGVGNLLLRDEGFGVHVVREFEKLYSVPPELAVVDGGCVGLSLIDYLRGKELAVVVDVVAGEGPTGNLHVFTREDLERFEAVKPPSLHDFGLVEALRAAEFAGVFPEKFWILAAVPEDISAGVGLSPSLERSLPAALKWIEGKLIEAGIPLRRRKPCA